MGGPRARRAFPDTMAPMRQNDFRPRVHGVLCAFAAAAAIIAAIVSGGCGVKGPLRLPPAAPGTAQPPTTPPAPAPEAMPTETPTTSPQPAEPRKP